jgi:transposase-like protein
MGRKRYPQEYRDRLVELARIKEERDILAKATAWFAKETTRIPSRSTRTDWR